MQYKKLIGRITAVVGAAALLFGVAVTPASANDLGVNASVGIGAHSSSSRSAEINARVEARSEAKQNNLSKTIARGDTEIAKRIESLNKLSARVADMKNVSASVKASISSQVQAQIASLTTLKASIDAGTSASSTRDLDKSIMTAYRIYALVLPQAQILAAADRVSTIADLMAGVSAKLQVKIDAAHAAGKDVASLQTSLADIAVKSADAKTQASIAINAVATLTPDNGDTAKASANHAALVSARANIKTATSDLETARKDARSITQGLKAFHLNASSTSSVETNH